MEKSWIDLNEELRLEIESLHNPVFESILIPVSSEILQEAVYEPEVLEEILEEILEENKETLQTIKQD
jgi:hypothetical protein